MAIGAYIKASVRVAKGSAIMHQASVRGTWYQANDNLEAAQSAGELLSPASIALSTFHWVRVPDGATRILYRAKSDVAATTVVTSPIVQIWGAYGIIGEDGSFSTTAGTQALSGTDAAANFARFLRLDGITSGATGVTLTLAVTGVLNDASYRYHEVADLTGVDLKGAEYVGIIVATAGSLTGGASNGVYGEILFIN